MDKMREIKFGELRRMISVIDRISMCDEETSYYENYRDIKDVPEKYDELYVCGIGVTQSEFTEDADLHFMPCMEILVSKNTRTEFEDKMRKMQAERRKRRESRGLSDDIG